MLTIFISSMFKATLQNLVALKANLLLATSKINNNLT